MERPKEEGTLTKSQSHRSENDRCDQPNLATIPNPQKDIFLSCSDHSHFSPIRLWRGTGRDRSVADPAESPRQRCAVLLAHFGWRSHLLIISIPSPTSYHLIRSLSLFSPVQPSFPFQTDEGSRVRFRLSDGEVGLTPPFFRFRFTSLPFSHPVSLFLRVPSEFSLSSSADLSIRPFLSPPSPMWRSSINWMCALPASGGCLPPPPTLSLSLISLSFPLLQLLLSSQGGHPFGRQPDLRHLPAQRKDSPVLAAVHPAALASPPLALIIPTPSDALPRVISPPPSTGFFVPIIPSLLHSTNLTSVRRVSRKRLFYGK